MDNISTGMFRKLSQFFFEQKCIPWSLSTRYENWLEKKLYFERPTLYQLLRYGRLSSLTRPLTTGPEHHFFGYYEKTPWNQSGDKILAHQSRFNNRPPEKGDTVKVGFVDTANNDLFVAVSESSAWNWQQGSMLQWHPSEPDTKILFNDRRDNLFVNVCLDLVSGEECINERPFYAISPKGDFAYSLNFARLQTWRPGYGYAGLPDQFEDQLHPKSDGVFLVDLKNGKSKLIISIDQLAQTNTIPSMVDTYHWINHIQVSPSGKSFAFFHIWRVGKVDWCVRLYTANFDGSGLKCLLDTGSISHYDWRDDNTILIWAKHPLGKTSFLICYLDNSKIDIFCDNMLSEDGHCSYSPDRRWVLNDTYPDRHNHRTLMIVRASDERIIELDRYYSPKEKWWGEIRCDLHPRWNRSGDMICIDSVHSGDRQMYVIDLKGVC